MITFTALRDKISKAFATKVADAKDGAGLVTRLRNHVDTEDTTPSTSTRKDDHDDPRP